MKRSFALVILIFSFTICYSQANYNASYIANYIKLWGLIKFKTTLSDSKKMDFDELFLSHYERICSVISNEEYNIIITSFLQKFNSSIYPDDISISQENIMVSFNKNVFDKKNILLIKNISLKPFVVSNKYFRQDKFIKNYAFYENGFSNEPFPNEGKRILALARIWHSLYLFYPYKNLLSINLDELLEMYIPILKDCKNVKDYSLKILEISNKLKDSHAFVSSNFIRNDLFGSYILPIKTMYIDSSIVVTDVFNKSSFLKKGDIITLINNFKVENLIDSLVNILPYSNINSFKKVVNMYLFRSKNQKVDLKFKRGFQIDSCQINGVSSSRYIQMLDSIDAISPAYKILDSKTIYLNISLLKNKNISNSLKMTNNFKNIILDLRNYPNQTIDKICDFFSVSKNKFALIKYIKENELGRFADSSFTWCGKIQKQRTEREKIYLLVDNGTMSQAEYTAMAIQTLPNVITIGNQSAGADGNVSYTILPGDIKFYFTGIGVYYPNGTITQKFGIRIDNYLNYKISDILKGKDTILEYVLTLIQKDENKEINN